MAAFRAFVILGLLGLSAAVGAQSSDLQSLVQKNVGVHGPDNAAINLFRGRLEEEEGQEDAEGLEDSLEVPPRVVLNRLPLEMVSTAKTTVTTIWAAIQHLLDTVQEPFLGIVGVSGPELKQQKPEELMELFTAYIVAFKDGKFPAVVNATIENITKSISSVGNSMAAAALELIGKEGSSDTGVKEHAAMWLERAAYDANRAYAEAAAKYFQAMKAGIQQMPTKFLKNATVEYKAWLDAAAGDFDADKTFKENLKPKIKGLFTKETSCATLRESIPGMVSAETSLRADVSAAIADIRAALPDLDYFAAVIARRRSPLVMAKMPEALASFNYFLDSTEASILKFAGGMHVLNKAMVEVATQDLNCTIA